MEQYTLNRLNTLSDKLQVLYDSFDTSIYTTPINRKTEKQKFLDSYVIKKVYNPQFSYESQPTICKEPLSQFLSELHPEQNIWEDLIYKDVVSTIESIEAKETHDPILITNATLKRYGEISTNLVDLAYEALEKLSLESEPRTITSEEMVKQMNEAITKVGLHDWSVIVSDTMNARISVRSSDKQIRINANSLFTVNELKRLLVHEIGTHVFRSLNGHLQPLKLLRFILYDCMTTEEGLANYHEGYYSLQLPVDQRRYALRVIAAYQSLNHSFYDVFSELAKHTTLDEAFDIVVRAKRGFTDTSIAGCHVKDKVYFEGFLKVSAYLREHPDDYKLLMCGKVGLSMLPELKKLQENGLLVEPHHLPQDILNIFENR